MKRFGLALGTILLALALVAGCTQTPAPTTPAPTTPAPVTAPVEEVNPEDAPDVEITQGTISAVNPSRSTVTVETPEGTEEFKVTPATAITLSGNACTIDQLGPLAASGENFSCVVVTDDAGNVLRVDVEPVPRVAEVKGTISDVNIKDSTVTVKTASGDKVFEVDPDTGLLIGGVACSLDLVNALVEAGASALPCTVVFSADDTGKAQYVDIANPPNLTQASGTIESVDVQKSTVTIQTDKGLRTFEVDAKTGQFLNGQVCSLADVEQAVEIGIPLVSCEVLFYTDANGDLVYLDIARQTP